MNEDEPVTVCFRKCLQNTPSFSDAEIMAEKR